MALAAVESNGSEAPAALVDIVRQIRELDHEHWGKTTRQYLSWQLGLTPAESARVCRLQGRLESLPLLRGELEAGRLSADTVATLGGRYARE